MTIQEAGWTALGFAPVLPVALAEIYGSPALAAGVTALACVLIVAGTVWIASRPAPEPGPRRIRAATPADRGGPGPGDWPETVYAGRAHVSGCPIEPGPAFRMLPDTATVQVEDRGPVRIHGVETAVGEILELARTGDMEPETAACELYSAGRLTIATGSQALDKIEADEAATLSATLGRGVEAAVYIMDDVVQVLADEGHTGTARIVAALAETIEETLQEIRERAGPTGAGR